MRWDRYDDAIDDLHDDEIDLKAENRALEKRLTQLGVKFDPHIQWEEKDIPDQDDMHWNKSQDLIALEIRNQYLKQLLAEAQGDKGIGV